MYKQIRFLVLMEYKYASSIGALNLLPGTGIFQILKPLKPLKPLASVFSKPLKEDIIQFLQALHLSESLDNYLSSLSPWAVTPLRSKRR